MKNSCEHDVFISHNRYDETFIAMSNNRIIFLSEPITKKVAADISAMLLYFDHQNNEEIDIYLHSDGGDALALANIYDVMQMISSPINTICMGKCYSAAAVLLSAGSKNHRYAYRNSKIMIHGIQVTFPIPGFDITNSKNYYDFLRENNDRVMKMLAFHTGNTLEKVRQDCMRDVWMDAKKALAYGIIDVIL